eukprot:1442956-Prymnesium_polylepis.1
MRRMREWFPRLCGVRPAHRRATATCGSASCVRPTPTSACAVMLWEPCKPGMRRSSPIRHYCDGETTRPRFRPADLAPASSVARCHPSPP